MDNSVHDADDVLRRMLAAAPIKKQPLVTQKMVEDLIEPLLAQSFASALQREAVSKTLVEWLSGRNRFENEAAKRIAEHHVQFLLPK